MENQLQTPDVSGYINSQRNKNVFKAILKELTESLARYVCRKLIPGFGSCYGEWPGTKVCDTWTDDEVAASGRSQSLSAANWSRWSTQIGEVRRCKSVKRFERQQAQLELDALLDRQPVEAVTQHMSDVVVLFGTDE